MSYDDSGDNRLVQIKLVVIRNWMDQLARVRQENSINRILWQQMSGEYQRLRAQQSPGVRAPQQSQGLEHGTPAASD